MSDTSGLFNDAALYFIKKNFFAISQVERRVVTQLAMAHERQLINQGSVVRVTVTNPEFLVSEPDNLDTKDADVGDVPQRIKLQILEEGSKESFKDITFDAGDQPFACAYKWLIENELIFIISAVPDVKA